MRLDVVVAIFTIAAGLVAVGVAMLFMRNHKEASLEEKVHNLLNLALAKIAAAGAAVGHGAQAGGASVATSAASALHATEQEAAYLLRAAADKIAK